MPAKLTAEILYQSVVHKIKPKKKKAKFRYGANEDNSATGVGGRDRRNKIDSIVDKASR